MRRKLLLADDSLTVQRVVELTFSGEDVEVIAVADGDQAVARIPAERPDIVLADIATPKRNGYEVAAFVKDRPDLAHIPVLLLAGAFEPVDEARAQRVGCAGVLVKPLEPHQVVARVRELVETRAPRPDVHVPLPEPDAAAGDPPERAPDGATATSGAPVHGFDWPPAEAGPVAGSGEASPLDSYFERLDAAFASLGGGTTPAPGRGGGDEDVFASLSRDVEQGGTAVPTIDDILGGAPLLGAHEPAPSLRIAPPPLEPADTSATLAPAAGRRPDGPAPGAGGGIVDVFNLLFAAERGEGDGASIRLGPPAASVHVTDDLVDQVTRRVLERLAPGAVRDVVADVVAEIAERLVREEIDRIKKAQG